MKNALFLTKILIGVIVVCSALQVVITPEASVRNSLVGSFAMLCWVSLLSCAPFAAQKEVISSFVKWIWIMASGYFFLSMIGTGILVVGYFLFGRYSYQLTDMEMHAVLACAAGICIVSSVYLAGIKRWSIA